MIFDEIVEIVVILDAVCLQKTGAEIGEFLTPMTFISYSYKKWTLSLIKGNILHSVDQL